ncbi:MAG: methylenetetrahydrofolate reductase [Deltaproteobacteria bacterium]|nr:methylenetetrahydrofolate reductase [Deltaproteobacteria bacterium]
MLEIPYIIEILTPRRSPEGNIDQLLDRFAERFQLIMEAGCALSIPDNPMGQLRLGALESFDLKGLTFDPETVMMNLNTFHDKDELDALLQKAADFGLKYILVIRGDGGPHLPRLDPKSIGGSHNITTTMDLLRYINSEFSDTFVTGAAFNPYKPMPFELDRAHQKMEAGAQFIVTQPVIGRNEHIDSLGIICENVVVEAWMSTNIDLFYKSVGRESIEQAEHYDPLENLSELHEAYPHCCIYLSMLSFKQDWRHLLPRLTH